VRTTTTRFGNPKAKPVVTKETGVLVAVTHTNGQKTATYRFRDGDEIIINNAPTKTTVTWAIDNINKTTRYEYADKTTHSVTELIEPVVTISWASDHITKITVTTFGNGKSQTATTRVEPSEAPVSYTEASYPSTWASGAGGTVTPPSVSFREKRYGSGFTETLETGESSKPFLQTTLSTRNISDPNAYVKTDITVYDLRWGTPDPAGPVAAKIFRDSGVSLTVPQFQIIAGYKVEGVCGGYACGGPTYKTPTGDVLQAWDQGWTGKGSKILIVDSFGKNIGRPGSSDFHGIFVSALAGYTAIGSEILTLDWSFSGLVLNAFNTPVTSGSLSAINMSFDLRDDTAAARTYANTIVSYVSTDSNFYILGIQKDDAVLVKAAGNDSKSITNRGTMTALTIALIEDATTVSKTLIVGALEQDGSEGNRANLATYSNTPGSDSKFSDRFVLANGTSPFAQDFAWDLTYDPGNGVGTSYAAPRVAGYIGILRHKFPNLNAEKSSSIILDTARTDTLWCHPSCESSVVGKGEASLSRALAPVGRLR
jgi:hypothetical protein